MHCTRLSLSDYNTPHFTNMKTIIAVTFLGILMQVFAKDCQLMSPVANFNFDKYSKIGHLYVTHSKNKPKENVCEEFDFVKVKSGNLETRVTEVFNTGGKENRNIYNCVDTPKPGKPGLFSIQCDITGSRTAKIELDLSVVATDYKNYAIYQSCFKSGQEEMLVLQRQKDGVHDGVKTAAKVLSLSLDNWFSRATVDCNDIKK